MRRRVITGTLAVVKAASVSPQRAAQETFRPKRASASPAMRMRRSRVSSRKASMRARAATARVSSASSPPSVVATAGSANWPMTRNFLPIDPHLDRCDEPVVGNPPRRTKQTGGKRRCSS